QARASADSLVAEANALSWSEWEPVAGEEIETGLLLVRRGTLPGAGLALALMLCLVFWKSRDVHRQGRLTFLLCWLTAGALALLWLPAGLSSLARWPLLAGSMIALIWYLHAAMKTG